MTRDTYLDLLDELFDVYDRHLRFLEQFEDLGEHTTRLSEAFVQEHDILMAAACGGPANSLQATARIMDVAAKIMYFVLLKGGSNEHYV